MFGGYSYNERTALSLGIVIRTSRSATVLTLVWGEENGGTQEDRPSSVTSSSTCA